MWAYCRSRCAAIHERGSGTENGLVLLTRQGNTALVCLVQIQVRMASNEAVRSASSQANADQPAFMVDALQLEFGTSIGVHGIFRG